MTGKKNIVFGLFYLVITLALGMYLSNRLGAGDPEWLQGKVRAVLRAAHGHGNLEALNIVLGYLLARLAIDGWIAKTASILLIVGAVFHSGMLYLGGLGVAVAPMLTPVGAVSLLLAVLLTGAGVLRLQKLD
jgi:uncharacterized membrane protein YgdD (TMEM256/DUF423 family)